MEHLDRGLYQDFLKRPQKYLGDLETAHLWMLSEPLRLIAEAKVFRQPSTSDVQVSPHQYILRCYTGPLIPTIDRAVTKFLKRRDGHADVLDALSRTNYLLAMQDVKRRAIWRRCFGRSNGPLLDYVFPCSPLFLNRALIALKTREGIWCQSYSLGRPDANARLFKGRQTATGLLTAASLNPEIFRFLPYTIEDVRAFLSKQSVNLSIDWHLHDDLLDDTTQIDDFLETWMFDRST